MDTFDTNTLSGGTGWSAPWSGGTVADGQLQHPGNPQQISRTFPAPALSSGATGANAGFFSIKADLKFNYPSGVPQQDYGFRTFQESSSNGTFSAVWKRDTNAGQLTFLADGQTVVVPGISWNITSTTTSNFTYTLVFDVSVQNGKNSNQYRGSYQAQVVRSDGLTYTTGSLPWVKGDINLNNLQKVTIENTNPQTTVGIDNVILANTSQITFSQAVPEPRGVGLLLLVSGLFLHRRQRWSVAVE